jgi:hypothetical protein
MYRLAGLAYTPPDDSIEYGWTISRTAMNAAAPASVSTKGILPFTNPTS